MAEYTFNISESNSKAIALLEYLKSLDFIDLKKTNDWWNELSKKQQQEINLASLEVDNGEVSDYETIMKGHR